MVLPFADITLLTANTATAIISASILAIFILGEKFVWQYDLTALLLMISGGALTVIQSNKKKIEYSAEEVKELLHTKQT